MKAIRYDRYGGPEVLQLVDMDVPVPAADEVLVRIHSASVNPLDWHIMRASPFLARFSSGLFRPNSPKLGADLAGTVEAVGAGVTEFQPGERVFGELGDAGLGSLAEYAVSKTNVLARIPEGVSFAEAAATPVAGFTALQGLRDAGKIAVGERVLVNGASGGVGTYAVQIAKAYGAHVTGVCSTRNLDLVKSIGADEVIDYTRQDFTAGDAHYNLIYDAVGNRSPAALRKALLPGGRAVVAGFTSMGGLAGLLFTGWWHARGGYAIGLMPTARSDKTDLETLAEMVGSGKIKPVIDRTYPLAETADAIAYLETMRARGKVIVTIVE